MKLLSILLAMVTLTACAQQTSDDTFTTKSGKTVVITPIKHASIRINYDGCEIEVDPVIALESQTDYKAMPKADYIFVTHEHFDHCDKQAVADLKKEGTIIIANPNSAKILGEGTVMVNGDKRELAKDITIEAVPAYNITPGREKYHPKGRDNGYILTVDGLRIYIAGDTEDFEEMSAIKNIDVAFLPTNQPFTMTPEQTAKVARIIKPKVLYPYHFSDTKIEQVAELLKGTGIDVRIRNFK